MKIKLKFEIQFLGYIYQPRYIGQHKSILIFVESWRLVDWNFERMGKHHPTVFLENKKKLVLPKCSTE